MEHILKLIIALRAVLIMLEDYLKSLAIEKTCYTYSKSSVHAGQFGHIQ